MNDVTCPRCGESATGNFCASCGASLKIRTCDSCGAAIDPGARFCTTCGSPVATAAGGAPASATPAGAGVATAAGAASVSAGERAPAQPKLGARAAASKAEGGSGGGQFGWWMAGTMLVFLLAVVAYPVLVPQESRLENPGPTGGAMSEVQQFQNQQFGNAQNVDLSSMTPIQAADRLFERVMTLYENEQPEQVEFFLPMAISAYQQAEPLDADRLYHLSTLHRVANQPGLALSTAQRILDETPTHLFGLYEAAEAQLMLGDTAAATGLFGQILENWEAEQGVGRQEYELHARAMPTIRQTAEELAGN
jgi:hypothetical protein